MSLARIAALATLLSAAACSRTAIDADCPNGYAFDPTTSRCVCSTDEGCPTGMQCEASQCVCRGTACCPDGYQYSVDAESCVCRASRCCPKELTWLPDEARCACNAQDCCPAGYAWSALRKICECAGDACCPAGHGFNPTTYRCDCASDECCPVDYRWDPVAKDCVCAKSSCCPPNHSYEPGIGACVCVGDTCCPAGFRKAPDGSNRCVCLSNASCPANQVCDPVGGGCRCTGPTGCAADHFCNSLGFCQSTAACTSNLDCPGGTFCDITTSKCLANGPCTIDEHCAPSAICAVAQLVCKPGCRRDGDCAPKLSCVAGQCSSFCRDNQSCPVGQFCDLASGHCAPKPGRVDCQSCNSGFGDCGPDASARCLGFITEGQTSTFCGMLCQKDSDCPAGFDCGSVIYGCQAGLGCEAVSGETISCKAFQVENEAGDQYYCADSTGQPHTYFKACAPLSGSCPAVAAP